MILKGLFGIVRKEHTQMKTDKNVPLRILNVLMTTDKPQTTADLMSKSGCDRKSVYRAISVLENTGFHINVEWGQYNRSFYSFNGIYGMDVE